MRFFVIFKKHVEYCRIIHIYIYILIIIYVSDLWSIYPSWITPTPGRLEECQLHVGWTCLVNHQNLHGGTWRPEISHLDEMGDAMMLQTRNALTDTLNNTYNIIYIYIQWRTKIVLKITLLRVIPTMTFQNSLLTPLLSEAFVTGLLPN